MTQKSFKVLDWIREIRDAHSEQIENKTPEEILQEASERAEKMSLRIQDERKKKSSRN
mgnify:FL=1